MTIYQDCIKTGIETDNHESDLYIPETPETIAILKKHDKTIDGWNVVRFTSNIDGKQWLDVPFQYDPFWERHCMYVGIE